jgi:hypothetical protein
MKAEYVLVMQYQVQEYSQFFDGKNRLDFQHSERISAQVNEVIQNLDSKFGVIISNEDAKMLEGRDEETGFPTIDLWMKKNQPELLEIDKTTIEALIFTEKKQEDLQQKNTNNEKSPLPQQATEGVKEKLVQQKLVDTESVEIDPFKDCDFPIQFVGSSTNSAEFTAKILTNKDDKPGATIKVGNLSDIDSVSAKIADIFCSRVHIKYSYFESEVKKKITDCELYFTPDVSSLTRIIVKIKSLSDSGRLEALEALEKILDDVTDVAK